MALWKYHEEEPRNLCHMSIWSNLDRLVNIIIFLELEVSHEDWRQTQYQEDKEQD